MRISALRPFCDTLRIKSDRVPRNERRQKERKEKEAGLETWRPQRATCDLCLLRRSRAAHCLAIGRRVHIAREYHSIRRVIAESARAGHAARSDVSHLKSQATGSYVRLCYRLQRQHGAFVLSVCGADRIRDV